MDISSLVNQITEIALENNISISDLQSALAREQRTVADTNIRLDVEKNAGLTVLIR